MAASPSVIRMSVEEYLRTSFEPDAEYVDGYIEERPMGEWDHGKLQLAFTRIFDNAAEAWNIDVVPEWRVQVSPTRFRVPDVCVTDARFEPEQIGHRAPLLCIEVLSPEDRLPRMLKRVQDFHRMGVSAVWIFDPETRRGWVSTDEGATEWTGGVLTVPGTKIALDPADAFTRAARKPVGG